MSVTEDHREKDVLEAMVDARLLLDEGWDVRIDEHHGVVFYHPAGFASEREDVVRAFRRLRVRNTCGDEGIEVVSEALFRLELEYVLELAEKGSL